MARKGREPTIELREHRCADGSITEYWSVRYFDTAGARRIQNLGLDRLDGILLQLVEAQDDWQVFLVTKLLQNSRVQ